MNLAISLEQKPPGFRTIKGGKKLTLYRGDKNIGSGNAYAFTSRGAILTAENAYDYLEEVKKLLETDASPSEQGLLNLKELFPKDYHGTFNNHIQRISEQNYHNWCDYFIDLHTSKTPIDPFVSLTSCRTHAGNYSKGIDEVIHKIKIRGNRILTDQYNRGNRKGEEYFAIGAVTHEEVT